LSDIVAEHRHLALPHHCYYSAREQWSGSSHGFADLPSAASVLPSATVKIHDYPREIRIARVVSRRYFPLADSRQRHFYQRREWDASAIEARARCVLSAIKVGMKYYCQDERERAVGESQGQPRESLSWEKRRLPHGIRTVGPVAKLERRVSKGSESGAPSRSVYLPNPCENKHLIPNPSLGLRIVSRTVSD